MNTDEFQKLMLQKLDFIEAKLGLHDEGFDSQNKTAHLVEFETETKNALQKMNDNINELKEQFDIVEKLTKQNTYDIAKLKAAR